MPLQNSHSLLDEEASGPHSVEEEGTVGAQPARLSLLDFLIFLAERKWTVLSIAGLVGGLAFLVSLLLPTKYTAMVTLMTPQQNVSLGAAMSAQLGNLGGMAALAGGSGLGLKNPNDPYVGMLRSRTVEDTMVQHYGLGEEYHTRRLSDAREAFERHTKVDGSQKDGLIHISVEDRDPARAAQLANAYVDAFRTMSEHLAITEAAQRRLFFERQLVQAKDNLATAEESLKQTEQATGVIQLDSQARALIESAASLRAQVAAKEVQIESMQTYATQENSQVIQLQKELDGLRSQLAKLGSSAGGGDDLIVPRDKVTKAGLEYIRKLRDVKYYESVFEILSRQFEAAKLDEARQGAVIQIVDSAVPPDRKSFPHRSWFLAGGLLLGLLVGASWVVTQAALAHMDSGGENSKLRRLRRALRLKTGDL